MTTRTLLAQLLSALSCGVLAPSASALTVLDARLHDVSCVLNGPDGAQSFACQTFSASSSGEMVGFSPYVAPGHSATVHGFIEYAYSDDGWPLDRSAWFQMDPNGFVLLETDHEGGALYAASHNCTGSRYCPPDPGIVRLGDTGFPPLLLGLNDVSDRLSGRIPVSGTLIVPGDSPHGAQQDVYVRWSALAYSGVAPIPEAPVWLLLSVGLLVLGLRSHSRTSN